MKRRSSHAQGLITEPKRRYDGLYWENAEQILTNQPYIPEIKLGEVMKLEKIIK